MLLSGCGGGGVSGSSTQNNIQTSNQSDPKTSSAISFDVANYGLHTTQHPVTYAILNESLQNVAISYTWDFNDGTAQSYGKSVTHTYSQPGQFQVSIQALVNGVYSYKRFLVIVTDNSPPTLDPIRSSSSFTQGESFTFSASGNDKDGDNITFQWDFGDGTPPQNGEQANHVYTKTGPYKIRLSANDGYGGTSLVEQSIFVDAKYIPPTQEPPQSWSIRHTNLPKGAETIFWVTPQIGYIGFTEGNVAKTIDGGVSWENVPLGINAPVFSLFFFDKDHGIAGTWGIKKGVPGPNDGSGLLWSEYPKWGMLMFTSDGGKTWTSAHDKFHFIPKMEADDVRGLFFHDTLNGWAVGTSGYLGHTTDGGKIWTTINLNTRLDFKKIFFIDPMHGWIIANPNSNAGYAASIFRTEDGGQTWEGVVLPTTEFYTIQYIGPVHFSDQNTGWVCASSIFSSIQHLFRTLDGGKSWTRMPAPPFGEISNNIPSVILSGVFSINDNEAIIPGNDGTVYRTKNAGVSWTKEVELTYDTIDFYKGLYFFSVKNDGTFQAFSNRQELLTYKPK